MKKQGIGEMVIEILFVLVDRNGAAGGIEITSYRIMHKASVNMACAGRVWPDTVSSSGVKERPKIVF